MNLTSRTKKILYILIEEQDYITVKDIAEQIGVSSRTILREMSLVTEWLKERQVSLEKKKGTGIKILANDKEKKELQKLLIGEKDDNIYSPKLRYVRLKYELLQTYEPRKIYSFTELFNVTEGTISNDLDNIESWFSKYNISLIKKQGIGVYIKGTEISIRKAIVALIYENIPESDLIYFIKGMDLNEHINFESYQKNVNAYLLDLMDVEYINIVKEYFDYLKKYMGYCFADNSFVTLIIRFAVTFKRISQNFYISNIPKVESQLESQEYKVLKKILDEKKLLSELHLPSYEIEYLAIHVKGAKRSEEISNNKVSISKDYQLIKLAKKMIYVAQTETGSYLEDNEKLLLGLVRHLGPAINRIKLNLDILNPLLEDIKSSYPMLFKVTKKCVKIVEDEEKIVVPEEEIAYIATHIGAAIKKETTVVNKRFRVVIACTNGIGASRLLASEIKKEFNNLIIVDIVSTIDFDEKSLKDLHVDIIISTVPINVSTIPTILVSTILTNRDKKRIKEFLEQFVPISTNSVKENKMQLKDKLVILDSYSKSIMQVLNHFFLIEDLQCNKIDELIEIASSTITSNSSQKKELIQAFKDREEKGTTLLGQKGMILLHCRSHVINELYFMVLRLQDKIKITDKRGSNYEINTISVMVAPIDAKSYELEVLSEVSRIIITTNFGQALKNSDETVLYEQLDKILEEFYIYKVNNLSS